MKSVVAFAVWLVAFVGTAYPVFAEAGVMASSSPAADAPLSNALDIPAFRVGSANPLQFNFDLSSQKTGLCQGVAQNPAGI